MNPTSTFPGSSAALPTTWFDGRSPKPHPASLHVLGDQLLLTTEDGVKTYALRAVRWPERRSAGARLCSLPDGSLLEHSDGPAWDAWYQAQGLGHSWAVAWALSWRTAGMALLACIVLVVCFWFWGIPVLTHYVVQWLPPSVEQRIGQQALAQIQESWLKPSALKPVEQAQWRARFNAAVQRAYGAKAPAWQLHFHEAPFLGPNAFALPGGEIVVTDELVKLLQDQPDALLGVLGHELGHVQHQHGMKMAVRVGLVGAVTGVLLGDAGTLLATVPSLLLTQGYSRDSEREADQDAAVMLHRNGISPSAMALFFERIRNPKSSEKSKHQELLPISISSHPADAERIAFFRNWTPAQP
jgi:Zn-dependent protease with chaperone function